MHREHLQVLRATIIICLLGTLPKDYREDAKYCFYELTDRREQTLSQALQYLIGGLEYRIEGCFEIVEKIIAISMICTSKMVQLESSARKCLWSN